MSDSSQDSTNVGLPAIDGPLAKARQRQQMAWQAGRNETVEQLVADFPELALDREALLDLVYLEILRRDDLHRQRRGELPTLVEYRERFPACQSIGGSVPEQMPIPLDLAPSTARNSVFPTPRRSIINRVRFHVRPKTVRVRRTSPWGVSHVHGASAGNPHDRGEGVVA